ncbi:hypothetical protein GQR58_013463 [Nymphon striatum]|nr:hypothetical protein GQR58_013463 [Nymphon striatum]
MNGFCYGAKMNQKIMDDNVTSTHTELPIDGAEGVFPSMEPNRIKGEVQDTDNREERREVQESSVTAISASSSGDAIKIISHTHDYSKVIDSLWSFNLFSLHLMFPLSRQIHRCVHYLPIDGAEGVFPSMEPNRIKGEVQDTDNREERREVQEPATGCPYFLKSTNSPGLLDGCIPYLYGISDSRHETNPNKDLCFASINGGRKAFFNALKSSSIFQFFFLYRWHNGHSQSMWRDERRDFLISSGERGFHVEGLKFTRQEEVYLKIQLWFSSEVLNNTMFEAGEAVEATVLAEAEKILCQNKSNSKTGDSALKSRIVCYICNQVINIFKFFKSGQIPNKVSSIVSAINRTTADTVVNEV